MSKKDLVIGERPSIKPIKSTETWVKTGNGEQEEYLRLTIDVPASLKTRIKTSCASRNVNMTKELTKYLMEKYPPDPRFDS